jgi:hypothetical protein
MTLLTAHRILISTAVVFFFGFALWEIRNYFVGAENWAVLRGVLYIVVAVGFAAYLKNLKRWYR